MTLDELNVRLEEFCSLSGLNASRAFELGIVAYCALGSEFFESPVCTTHRITLEPQIAHPLLKTIVHADGLELGLRELLELGVYLETFAADSSIKRILLALRNYRLYESTFFQLAMAYRLSLVSSNVTLEPKTDRGESDILFTFQGKAYVAECYRISRGFLEYMGEFETLLAWRLVDSTPDGRVLRLLVHIGDILSYDGMRQTLRVLEELTDAFFATGNYERREAKIRGVSLTLEDITHAAYDPDFGPHADDHPDKEVVIAGRKFTIERISDLEQAKQEPIPYYGSRAVVSRAVKIQLPKDPWQTLEARIGDKLKQTKVSASDSGRILFVQFPWGVQSPRQIVLGSKKVQADFRRKFPDVGAVFVLKRQLIENRSHYSGGILLGESPIPDKLIDALQEVEMNPLF